MPYGCLPPVEDYASGIFQPSRKDSGFRLTWNLHVHFTRRMAVLFGANSGCICNEICWYLVSIRTMEMADPAVSARCRGRERRRDRARVPPYPIMWFGSMVFISGRHLLSFCAADDLRPADSTCRNTSVVSPQEDCAHADLVSKPHGAQFLIVQPNVSEC